MNARLCPDRKFRSFVHRSLPLSLAIAFCMGGAQGLKAQTPATPDLSPVAAAPDPAQLHPVERIPRSDFGVVGPFPLTTNDLTALLYPSATVNERQAGTGRVDLLHDVAYCGRGSRANRESAILPRLSYEFSGDNKRGWATAARQFRITGFPGSARDANEFCLCGL